ncbi:hypothetical protein CB0940_06103 [Cercospora beticola]|uniref:Aminoglycoside phosphotransferase domain-containing protein n=1 Tax=Cercospora beticola TaxID=122368 RepID=A0A2G5HZA7_CERBT|nr:hypothetical protein CB0940_06103 [Cercospora beticola]PIA97874.1 hypothetical protein CB0940_06103 [Cercospora beticola]WPA98717.1 hypothetical protein RHO25_003330 [Cercospora beticola]CAK1359988.1 unnamed protein product [Cercospora beticola]
MAAASRVLTPAEWASATTLPPEEIPNVFKIDEVTVAKTGLDEARAKSEVAAMEFARSRTSMPIPKVYNCYLVEDTQKWCILMEYVDGTNLTQAWEEASDECKTQIVHQLRGFLEELRSVKGEFIGSVDRTFCRDQFFEDQDDTFGPFATEAEFHNALISVMRSVQSNAWVEMVVGFVESLPTHDIVLTHSDFHPRNIIVRDDKVVAILDWELAGFYPAYWEYVKANYLPNWDDVWVKERVTDRILERYPVEHAIHIHASRIVW